MDLTTEQRAIIEAEASDVAVVAGAGSGKTHVLVERYLRLLRDCSIPEIAAITFTEAAATEMRERVRRAVMSDPALEQHRELLDEAAIGTVHSLGLRLLHEFPVEAGLDPSASVLADDEAELLRQAACIEAIDAAAEAGDERTAALLGLGVYHAGLQLPRMVAQRDAVNEAFEAMGADSSGWPAYLRATFDERYRTRKTEIRGEVAAIAADIRRGAGGVSEKLAEVVHDVLQSLADACESDTWEKFAALLGEAAAGVKLNVGRRAPPDSDVKYALRELRDELAAESRELPAWNEHDEPALAVVAGLRDLFGDAVRRYEAAKREQGALDYLDLELGAVALLRDHPAVAAEVRERFRHLMVDESQDINPIQAELIELLAGGDGTGPRPALFLVGDARQSIYRFRGADVHRFTELQQLVTSRTGRPPLPLSRSFRSHEALVGNINDLFGEVFAGTALSLAAAPPMTGRPAAAPADGPSVTLTPIASKTPDGSSTQTQDRRRVEADLLAAEIHALLQEGRHIWDRREDRMRPARPGDIAILLRRFTNVHVFQQALDTHGIPAATPSGTGFFTRQEVLDCINLLRWLAEPQDDIALTGVLRSPFFALADDTLLALRERGRPALAIGDPPAQITGEERDRCAHASETLAELRRAADSLPADALLELALDRTGFEASWAPLAGGEQALANIRKLLRIVRTLAGQPLTEVVSYLEARRDDLDPREGPATLDRPDAVQLMTVHGAKGLEFPIVFVPEAHLSSKTAHEAVRWSPEGISVTLEREEDDETRPRPGFYAHLFLHDQSEDTEEHRRLFYVAATRAGDYLHISGDQSGRGGWLHTAVDAHEGGALRAVELREPLAPDASALAQRRPPPVLQPPADDDEVDYTPPLLARPPVIPLRASTPVTALRPPEANGYQPRRGDGLGALRGTVVHRAIEVSGGAPESLDADALPALVREQSERALDDATVQALAGEVWEMLDRFTRTPVAAALAERDVERWFELPFAWDWDGVPVHGSVDLVYRDAAGWHVIDFKSDRLDGASAREVGSRYAVQIGLYQRAIEAAVGEAVSAGLLFLRSGELERPEPATVEAALADARQRVDAGAPLDPVDIGYLDGPE